MGRTQVPHLSVGQKDRQNSDERDNKGGSKWEAGDQWCLCSVDSKEQRLKREAESLAQKLLNLSFLWWGRCTRSSPSREQQRLETAILVGNQHSKGDPVYSLNYLVTPRWAKPCWFKGKNTGQRVWRLEFSPGNVPIFQLINPWGYVRIALGTCNTTMNISLICCQPLEKSLPLLWASVSS